MHVFPSVVESAVWHNTETLLAQDLSEDALLQQFDRSNSAYIDMQTPESLPEPVVVPGVGPPDGSAPIEHDPQEPAPTSTPDHPDLPQVNQTTTPEAADESEDVTTETVPVEDVPAESIEEEQQTGEDDVPQEIEDAPSVESEPGEEIGFIRAAKGLFRIVSRVTSIFPFASESTTTPIVVDSASESESSSVEELPEEEHTEESIAPDTALTETTGSSTATQEDVEGEIDGLATSTPPVAEPEEQVEALNTKSPVPQSTQQQPEASLILSDFSIPQLASGQFITNVQLRMSLAALPEFDASSSIPSLAVSYKLTDDWVSAGSVLLDDEISNALNGGYFLFALPTFTDVSDLQKLEVKIEYRDDSAYLSDVYLDAAWLEVNTEVFDRDLLVKRSQREALGHLRVPQIHEMLGNTVDFLRTENPVFTLRYTSQRNVAVRFFRSIFARNFAEIETIEFRHRDVGLIGLDPKITMTEDGLFTIELTDEDRARLRPGEYTVDLEVKEGGKTFTDSFSFQWGLLAVNPDQTQYEVGDEAFISFGALTPNGNTLCNADLKLYVIDPNDFMYRVPVVESGLCNGNNVIDVPDYSAHFTPQVTGEYEMYVERVDENDSVLSHTSDTFLVVREQNVAVHRNGPTRIYPPSLYPMEITVHADDSFSGTLIERVPASFTIAETDANMTRNGEYYELSWDVDLMASSSKTFSYQFDAPDLSPYLYELGPAELMGEGVTTEVKLAPQATSTEALSGTTTEPVLETQRGQETRNIIEHRKWQIASDATGNMILFWDNNSTVPTDWTCISCAGGDTLFQRFVRGDSTYNTTGGTATHTPTASGSVLASSLAATESGAGSIAPVSHQHTYAPTIGGASNLPSYRQLRIIQYTASAGEPPSIPEGAIGIFDIASSSLPVGWSRYALHDGYYIYGENTAGTTGGSNSHSHTITGTTGNSDGSGQRVRGGVTVPGATDPHTHDIDDATPSFDAEPPYLEVMLAQVTAVGSTSIPSDLISMWTEDVPAGWSDVSSGVSDPFNGKFIKASTTYGTTGGSETHVHADVSTTSLVPDSTTAGRIGSAGADGGHTHTVNITNFSTANHLPPYATVVFGKKLDNTPVYDQRSFRWFVNEDAEPPTDPWPSGVTNLDEGQAITSATTKVKDGDVIRLRVNTLVTNVTSTPGTSFKLQYAPGDTCSAIGSGSWSNVGSATSSEIWRGYDNGNVADHAALSSSTLASTTVTQTYEENGFATGTPNQIGLSDVAEWDFVLEQNGAAAGTNYCFRMVEEDESPLNIYTAYPKLLTNSAPIPPTLTKLFDNEKTPTTSPLFEFVTSDPESEDVRYQIQVDNDHDFSSTVIDRNSQTHSTQFENLVTSSDKDPYTSGQLMRFTPQTTLSNGTTYYWRVRGRDPNGSNEWGEWSSIWSFTIDTSLTLSAWFQTEDEQFETGTLTSATTTGSDSVEVIATTTNVSILDGFTTGNTKTVSSGSNRLLVVGIHSEDSATNVNIGTVTYGGQLLTEIDDVQIGGGFSNGMWVGYLNEDGIQAASGNTIVPTWSGGTPDETVLYSSVVFENVDQENPVPSFSSNSGTTISTIQPTASYAVTDGDASVYFTVSGDTGQTHTAATNYTEGTEQDSGGSGSVAANAYRLITANGTEQPTADWTNNQSRLAIVALRVKQNAATMVSTGLDFDDGTSGNAWGTLSWNDTETSGEILYQLQYWNGSAWALIPDSDLSGNAAGFGTSPVSLLGLNTDTYNEIRLIANFSGTDLTLLDWTVSWGTRVTTPTITKLFANEKTATTTPTLEFTTTDPQGDALTYQMQWSLTPDFSASTTRTSDTDNGFLNIDNIVETDPFTSGDTIQFTFQPADALSDGETYWWRVRAKDPLGGDSYSFWTDARSFTVATDTVVSTWYQTTEEQFDSDILSGTAALASDAVSVASTAVEAMIVYGEGTETAPRYRQWNGSTISSEGTLQDIGATTKWAVVKAGITREEYVAATIGTDGDVNAQVFSLGSWGNLTELSPTSGNLNARGFDVAYETLSGDAMVAYCDGDADPSFYIWDGNSWTSGGTINLSETTNCEWIQLASNPTSDEIIVLSRGSDGNPYEAQVWDGDIWGDPITLGSVTETGHEGMAVEYEESGDEAIVVVSNGNPNRFAWHSWSGGAWSGAGPFTFDLGGDFEWGELVRDVGTDEMALCLVDDADTIAVTRWSGSGWALDDDLETASSKAEPSFSCVYEDTSGRDNFIMLTYADAAATNYQTHNTTAWSGELQVNSIGDSATMQLERTGDARILGLFFDDPNDRLLFSDWNGTSWSTTQSIENNASVDSTPFGKPYSIAPRNAGTQGTVIVSPGIDFDEGLGPYWQQMYWTDSTPGTSEILYSVQYWDGDSWEFIPDGEIPGNSAGTTTSPIDLSDLDKNTYNVIRPYAALTCDGSGNCPLLLDWTVEWSGGITVSGTIQEFDQTTNVNSGTVAVAVNGTLQTGKTGTISGGTWSISNVTAFPGDVVTVFVNGAATPAEKAVGVARYNGIGDMEGMQLYENHLALGSNDATSTPLTNGDVGGYDVDNDTDVFIDLEGTTLTLCGTSGCGDAELFINASTTYQPLGTLDTHDLEINGTFIANANTIYVSGSWDNNATATMATSSVIFTATSSVESLDFTGAAVSSFNNVTFGTSTGAATWNLNSPLDVNGSLTVTRGTLARGSQPITIERNLINGANGFWTGIGTTTFDGTISSSWSDQNATLQNVGDVVVDGTSKTITLAGNVAAESVTVGNNDILDASATHFDITVYQNWTNNNTFVPRQGEVFFAATTTNNVITAGNSAFYDLSFTGAGGSWSFVNANLSVNNDLTIATGTVTMPTGTTTLAGSFNASGGIFAHSNATVLLTSSGAETITANGTEFNNAFYNLTFNGSGSWTLNDQSATSSHNFTILQGSVTLPGTMLTVGGSFANSAGTFAHNSGSVKFTSAGGETIDANSSFNHLLFSGSGSWSFVDSNVTALGDLTVESGALSLPSGTLSLGGSFLNASTITHSSGTVLYNSTDTGETIDLGSSPLYNMTFNSETGGWTITEHATTTNNFTLATSSAFTLASGRMLSVGSVFTNDVGGASTTWTGSTLSLASGAYSINTKTNTGDSYETLRIAAGTDISMWNSNASTYDIDNTGSLYSQDHSGTDGDLYIFSEYTRTSGIEHWSYATDFDGTDLSGGSERQANVRFAAGASATLTDATLSVNGSSSASTTVSNQGSGTYTISLTGGTTTMRYYDIDDLGTSGISLLGATVVTSLDDGAFTPGINNGTALTVSSTTIDANPAKQIFRVNFSTTTAISATNTAQTDGAPASFWWFRNHSGNLDGEAYDNDTGDPGSIRWDDSSLSITIAGTIYDTDETNDIGGSATCSGGTPVRVVVNGGATYDGACDGNGDYSIPGVVVVGDPVITVFLNGAAGGEKAVAVTKTPTADILDLDLFVNRVVTRHEDTEAMSIEDMATFDSSDDPDILFTAATGTTDTLTVFPDNELHVWATSTFTPGGTVTLQSGGTGNSYDGSLHIDNAATFTGAGTTTYSIGGIFAQDAGASFIPASSTILMTATTSGKAITTENNETIDLNQLQFTGVGGSWNVNGNLSATGDIEVATGTVTGTGDITLTQGSFFGEGLLSLGGGLVTIEETNTLGGSQSWTFNDLTLGNGSVSGTTTPASTATTTIGGTLTIATGHYLDAGASVWNLSGTGSVFVEDGTFLEDTSLVRYSGNAAANILSTNYYDLALNASAGSPTYTATGLGIIVLNDLSVGGEATTTVTFDTNDTALDVDGDVLIRTNGTFVGSNSGQFTVGGSWDNDGTFTGSGGTVTFDSSGPASIAAGDSAFSTAVIDGTGDLTFSEHATATTLTLTAANSFTLSPNQALAVGGTFTNSIGGADTVWTNTTLYLYGGSNYEINASTTNDTYETLRIGSNTDIRMWNSSATAIDVDSTASLYSMDHANVAGDLYIYGSYEGNGGTDHWSYARDFDGTDLSGGSERKADVYLASGASTILTSGGLSVLGDPSASTTIQNQGSGTYSLRIGGSASTSWSYYEVRDTDSSGLTFSGTPNVDTLSFGDFLVTQAGGSGITVGGTAIDQNPAKTFTQNIFATNTAIAAFNVTATGTSVSSWRFTNHTGNIAGEDFDVDPEDDPGYIVWDDSAANITISGRVYSNEGTTVSTVCDSSSSRITLVVAGLTSTSTSCNGDGAGGGTGLYSIGNVSYSPGDSLIVYIDGVAQKGAVVSEDPVSSINNMDIYENRVIVRHEGTDPLSIADMAVWDSSDDPDIPFTAVDSSPDTLTLPADRKLIVWTGKEFEPGGNTTLTGGGGGADYDGTLELFGNAIFTAQGSESHSVGGSLISGAGASFAAANSVFTFTTTGAARSIDTNDDAFYSMVFNGSGSWAVTNSTLDVGNDFTLSQGSVTLPSGTTTVAGSFQNTGGSFDQNGGQVVFTASGAETIQQGGSDFGTTTFNGSGSWTYVGADATTTGNYTIQNGTVSAATGTLTIGGSFVNDDTFTHNSGTLRLTSGSSSVPITASSSDLFSLTIDGSGSFTITDEDIALLGDIIIEQGSVTLAPGTMSVGGSFLNNGGSFEHASGTILFNSTDTGETIIAGGSDFGTTTFSSGSGGWTIASDATSTSNFTLNSAANFTLASGNTLSVGGVFTNLVGGAATEWSGSTLFIDSGVGYPVNTKAAGGDEYQELVVGPNTDLRFWNSRATTTTVDSSSSVYSQDYGAVDGALNIYGDYRRTTGTDYWSYATDFDGTSLTGSERTVTVSHASGSQTTLSGGTLQIIGGSGATTTIQNQGSGTYGVSVVGGTLNALNYAFRDLNAEGLNLSGTTTITSLSNGDFELSVDSGSLITLSSTTLNFNASKVITGMRFATTTAITGANVELVGTTPAAWTFTSHRGNLDGEDFDIDGGTSCGSVRWDDSSCLITQQSHYRWRNDDGGESVPNSEWFDTDWTKRQRVTLSNSDSTSYTDAVIEIPITFDSDMQADFDDIRFTDSGGTTTLDYFLETYTASTDAVAWVKVPSLAASDETIIYMYYGNGAVSDASSGTSTFIAFDNYEDGDLSEYSGDTGEFTVTNTGDVFERSYSLKASDPDNGRTSAGGMYDNSNVVSQGETIRFLQYIVAGNGDESCTLFGTQTQTTNYAVCLELFGTERLSISKDVLDNDTSGTVLASTTYTYSTGWYEVEVDWDTDDTIFVSLYLNDTLVATTSATDSSYTSGGIGQSLWFFHGAWDIYSSRPLLTTEPSASFGFEQVSGGASWLSALDTKATGVLVGQNVRPRFVIENTGLSVTDQYQLEFAPKGNAPSCESVAAGDYSVVPPQSSCSGSDLCMVSSTQYVNRASTTDVLGGNGTFTQGQIVEDPDNDTQSITVDSNEFTEVEFAIEATNDVADSSYCLRVTDGGTDIDSYVRVAELELLFAPNITALSLNGGLDISLLQGGTTTVYATGTVTDLNGYDDLDIATSTIFRSGVGESCTQDDNNCYISTAPLCSFTNCAGNSCDVECTADIYYFAEPTDDGSDFAGQTWRALLSVSDQGGSVATATAPSVDLMTLRAISVDNLISYGSLAVNSDTGAFNPTTTVENIGNEDIDISIEGTDLSDGSSSIIPASEQLFATTTFTYSSCVICTTLSSTTPANLELDLLKPTTTATSIIDDVFWGINIPFGVAGTPHSGINHFTPIAD